MKFRALFGTPKQIMCHNSKNAQPFSTKFQGLLNLFERHAVDWIQDGLVGPCRKILPSCSVEASPSKAMVIKAYCCNAKGEKKAL